MVAVEPQTRRVPALPAATKVGARKFSPRSRKLWLSAHIVASVGWIGADICLIVLAATGKFGETPALRRAVYMVMDPIGIWVAVPLSIAALVTGIVLGAWTKWGLVRYWWVLASLIVTAAMTVAVAFALRPNLSRAADLAASLPTNGDVADALGRVGNSVLVAPCVSFALLCALTVINVMKPWGRVRRR